MSEPVRRPRNPRYDSLDMWRGLACLLVLVNHSVFYRVTSSTGPGIIEHLNAAIAAVSLRGWCGVPIFFVISGYCISATIDSHRRKGTSVGTYFFKRFRRIFPPYWLVLIPTAVIVGVGDVALAGGMTAHTELLRPWWYSPAQWFGSLTLTELWRPYLFGGGRALILGHAWTLCYEEQFYAVTGALLLLCPRRFFLGASVVTVGVALAVLAARQGNFPIEGFFFDGAWMQFALGILLYYVLNYGSVRSKYAASVGFGVVVLAAASFGSALLEPDKNQAQVFFIAGLFALAALWLHPFDRKIVDAPILRPIQSCGLMCYSLYLVHLPVANFIRAGLEVGGISAATLSPLVSLPLCGIPAIWISWRFHLGVERRFMNAPSFAAPPEPMAAAVAV